jgi:hypothetical protein
LALPLIVVVVVVAVHRVFSFFFFFFAGKSSTQKLQCSFSCPFPVFFSLVKFNTPLNEPRLRSHCVKSCVCLSRSQVCVFGMCRLTGRSMPMITRMWMMHDTHVSHLLLLQPLQMLPVIVSSAIFTRGCPLFPFVSRSSTVLLSSLFFHNVLQYLFAGWLVLTIH